MNDIPTEWSALCALAFLLGMRHGFDADHLAAIDGMTRLSSGRQQAFSRWCGALFSIGHGVIVMLIATAVGLLSARWAPPFWIDAFGAWVAIAFLVGIAITNLRAVLVAERGSVVALVGLKGQFLGRFLARLFQARSGLGVAAVGALFALSFDTVSQSALFAVMATRFGGVTHSLALGFFFVLGMLATDGVNGWWISRLLARADQVAAMVSRIMSVAVSAASLLAAGFGIAKRVSPAFDAWSEGQNLVPGAIVTALIVVSYLLAKWLARGSAAGRRVAPAALPPA
jgi:high-affinity nickel-transport protein